MTRSASMTDDLFARFEARILSGFWQPGAQLPTQKRLAEDEAVSRTVVREAVARLEAQGLATARRGAGVFVAEGARYRAFQVTRDEMTDLADVVLLLEMRLAVETEMAALAALRGTRADVRAMRAALAGISRVSDDPDAASEADSEFHLAIARASKNPYFTRFCEFLGVRLVPPRALAMSTTGEPARAYSDRVHDEHAAIIEAIERRDSDGARAAARVHMQESLRRHTLLRDGRAEDNIKSGN